MIRGVDVADLEAMLVADGWEMVEYDGEPDDDDPSNYRLWSKHLGSDVYLDLTLKVVKPHD